MYRHCVEVGWAWGRGQGFAAMGLAECLTYLPAGHSLRPRIVERAVAQLSKLASLQHRDGSWSQLVDKVTDTSQVPIAAYSIHTHMRPHTHSTRSSSIGTHTNHHIVHLTAC